MMREESQYLEKYGKLPNTQEELLILLRGKFKLKQDKIDAEIDRINNIPTEYLHLLIDIIPKGSPRPKYSSFTKTFYVKGAKRLHTYFQSLIKSNQIICTRVEYSLQVFQPTPITSMTNQEVYLAEMGLIKPMSTPDWDNLAKTYTDSLQGILLLNDNIINPGHVYKYYSIKPRIVIDLKYWLDYDSQYNRRKSQNSHGYKVLASQGVEFQDGVLLLDSIIDRPAVS